MPAELNPAKSIFLNALGRPAGEVQDAFLAEACGTDACLRQEVDELLAHHDQAGAFLEPAAAAPTVDCVPPAEEAGAVIGRYKLAERIGEGGMGEVWIAHQTDPVKRMVALTVIKAGMDTKAVLARFGAERQALALMDHPNIAKVLDGGATPGGRPYFVMELVKGTPITTYCDEHRLTPRRRLELFVPICQAVQHAHQKGVIHRDLKPSNVLVAPYDGKPVVKVIDFGVAKAAGVPLTEKTLVTGFGAVVGTPEYMSPEQAELNNHDIDTRSDVYSLGILLYELLTGSTPLTRQRAKAAALFEVLRLVREEEPPRPSTRLSTTDELPSIAASRGLEPKRLTGLMRGELDWIVMKALEKDRARRYESASAFATDVQRYLHDQPVQACPPSKWYRFCKFTRRNKARLAVAGLILLFILLLGAGAAWYQHERSVRAVALAVRRGETERAVTAAIVQSEKILAEGDKQIDYPERWYATARLAQVALEKAEELLAQGVGTEELAARVRQVRAAVDAGVRDSRLLAEVDRIRLEQAATKEEHFDVLGAAPAYADAFRDYGLPILELEPEEVARHIAASAIRDHLLGAVVHWARCAHEPVKRTKLTAVIRLADDSSRWRRLCAALDGNDAAGLACLALGPDAVGQPLAYLVTLWSLLTQTDPERSVEFLTQAQQRRPGDFWLNHDLGMLLLEQRPPRAAEAVRYLTAALALRPDSPIVHLNRGTALWTVGEEDAAIAEYRAALRLKKEYPSAHYNLGLALSDTGRQDEAIAEYREALRLRNDYPQAHTNLGVALKEKGLLDEAIAEYRQALATRQDFPEAYRAHCGLGLALETKGGLDEAIAEYRQAIRLNNDYREAHINLGTLLYDGGRLDAAVVEFREAIRIDRDDPIARTNLGNALKEKGLLDEAIAEYGEVIRSKRVIPKIQAYRAHYGLANALKAKRLLDEAIVEYREAIRIEPDSAEAHTNLGNALKEKGLLDEAIAEYRRALATRQDFPWAHFAHNNLGNALAATGRLDEAIAEYREALRLKKDYPRTHTLLGNALCAKGRLDEAIAEHREAIRIQPDFAEAYCNLGCALRQQGEVRPALAAYRRGHELGSKGPRWAFPSGRWVRECERLVDLDERLPAFLDGKTAPASPDERVELAGLCSLNRRHHGAVRFYAEAFAAEPKLAEDQRAAHRYNAACAAAQAGCGQGADLKSLDDTERARLRRQARDWLRADLAAWSKQLDDNGAKAAPLIRRTMQHWLADLDLAGVRGADSLAKLPEAERHDWQQLWSEVSDILARGEGKAVPPKKSESK